MPKVGETLGEQIKKKEKPKSKSGPHSASSGARKLRFEVPQNPEPVTETARTQEGCHTESLTDQLTDQGADQGVFSEAGFEEPARGRIEQSLTSALKVAQQSLAVGRVLAEQKFPKTKKVVEAVVKDWSEKGSFAELPVENPFIRKALQNGLVQAREVQDKVISHPQAEKWVMNLFLAGLKAQGLVEQWRQKVSSSTNPKKPT